MYKEIGVLLSIVLFTLSCQNSRNMEEEIWKLGWKMIDTSHKDYLTAERQFDTLLSYGINELQLEFISTGLSMKLLNGKKEEVADILGELNQEKLQKFCSSKVFASFDLCTKIELQEERVSNEDLQIELLQMFVLDQMIRGNRMDNLIAQYQLDKALLDQESKVDLDVSNQQRLKEIIEEQGFPTKAQVGQDAMKGVFFIIQHADNDPVWQRSQLPKMEEAVKNGDLNPDNYAYLYDRVQVNAGLAQRYGTQIEDSNPETGVVKLRKVKDPSNLDERRRAVGLMPIELYKKWMLER